MVTRQYTAPEITYENATHCILDDGNFSIVPLKSASVNVEVINGLCITTVTHTYINVLPQPIEVKYVFPMDPMSTVISFYAEVAGRKIRTAVKDVRSARDLYSSGVRAGRPSVLLEYSGQGDFTAVIGNLNPNETATTTTVSAMVATESPVLLDSNGDIVPADSPALAMSGRMVDAVRVSIPTTVAPRFSTLDVLAKSGTGAPLASTARQQPYVTYGLEFRATFTMPGFAETRIASTTHPDTFEFLYPTRDTAVARCKGGAMLPLDGDIVLFAWDPTASSTARPGGLSALVVPTPGDPTECTLVAQIHSESGKTAAADGLDTGHVVAVIDRSGSMAGEKIEHARIAARAFCRCVPKSYEFGVVAFSDYVSVLKRSDVRGTASEIAAADAFVESSVVAGGGTDVLAALSAAYSSILGSRKGGSAVGTNAAVLLVTDGEFDHGRDLLAVVAAAASAGVCTFTIGVGRDSSSAGCAAVAHVGLGAPEYAARGEDISARVIDQLKRMTTPSEYVDGFAVKKSGAAATAVVAGQQSEISVSRLSLGNRIAFARRPCHALAILKRSKGSDWTDVCATATLFSRRYRRTIDSVVPIPVAHVPKSCGRDDAVRAVVAGACAVDMSLESDAAVSIGADAAKAEASAASDIRAIGLEYGIATRETSFVGVEERSESLDAPGWNPARPIQMLAGESFYVTTIPMQKCTFMADTTWSAAPPGSSRSAGATSTSPESMLETTRPAQPRGRTVGFVQAVISGQLQDGTWSASLCSDVREAVTRVMLGTSKKPGLTARSENLIAAIVVINALLSKHLDTMSVWFEFYDKAMSAVKNVISDRNEFDMMMSLTREVLASFPRDAFM